MADLRSFFTYSQEQLQVLLYRILTIGRGESFTQGGGSLSPIFLALGGESFTHLQPTESSEFSTDSGRDCRLTARQDHNAAISLSQLQAFVLLLNVLQGRFGLLLEVVDV